MHAFSAPYVLAGSFDSVTTSRHGVHPFRPSSHLIELGICSARFTQVNLLLAERDIDYLHKNGTVVPEFDTPLRHNLVSIYESGIFRRLHFQCMWNGMDGTIRLRPVCVCVCAYIIDVRPKGHVVCQCRTFGMNCISCVYAEPLFVDIF